jgi:hypothetical protein
MSTHYLISHFNDEINDVVNTTSSPPQTLCTGNYVVRVPDDISVQNPTSLSDLLNKKYTAVLGSSGFFTQVIYDDMLEDTGVDTVSSTGVFLGQNGSLGLYPKHGSQTPILQTTPYNITWGGPGAGPVQAIFSYELFEFVDTDPMTSVYTRSYKEVPTDVDVTAQISFNGGANYFSASDKVLLTIPSISTGAQVIVRFTRTTDVNVRGRVYLGSWSVLF